MAKANKRAMSASTNATSRTKTKVPRGQSSDPSDYVRPSGGNNSHYNAGSSSRSSDGDIGTNNSNTNATASNNANVRDSVSSSSNNHTATKANSNVTDQPSSKTGN